MGENSVPDDYECTVCNRSGNSGNWQLKTETDDMITWQCPTHGCQHTLTVMK
jgi:hypothetical protein